MSSEAQRNQKRLDEEKAKPYPDSDIVYALESTRPYWNVVDTDAINRGFDKIKAEAAPEEVKGMSNTTRKFKKVRLIDGREVAYCKYCRRPFEQVGLYPVVNFPDQLGNNWFVQSCHNCACAVAAGQEIKS